MARTPVAPELRRARIAVSALFLTNGAVLANLLPRYPEIKLALGLSNAQYGVAIAAFPVGALIAGLSAGAVIRRLGSPFVASVGTVLAATAILLASVSPSLALLVLAFAIGGAFDSLVDVAQNAHALRVQRGYGRSILNSFHALWSLGAVIGGLMGAAAISLGLPLIVHLAISGALFSLVALVARAWMLPGADAPEPAAVIDDAPPARATVRSYLLLGVFALLAVGGAFSEDAGMSWAALYLGRELGASAQIAAFGLIAMMSMQFLGRIIGDGLVDRFGQRRIAQIGGLIIAVGLGSALAFPSVIGTIIGFGAIGLGCATLVPAAFEAAESIPGLAHGTGLTILSWLMRIGFLISPPLVGLLADATSLRTALIVVPIMGVIIALAAGKLRGRTPRG